MPLPDGSCAAEELHTFEVAVNFWTRATSPEDAAKQVVEQILNKMSDIPFFVLDVKQTPGT